MASAPILVGSRVTLRPPNAGDKATRLRLGRDPSIVRALGGDAEGVMSPLTVSEVERWYATVRDRDHYWVIQLEGNYVGGTFLHSFEEHEKKAAFALGIDDPELLGHGLGTEVVNLAMTHAFETLGLHRVSVRVLEYNMPAIRCFEGCGFKHEGTERESSLVDGEWQNDIRMAILEDEFRASRS